MLKDIIVEETKDQEKKGLKDILGDDRKLKSVDDVY